MSISKATAPQSKQFPSQVAVRSLYMLYPDWLRLCVWGALVMGHAALVFAVVTVVFMDHISTFSDGY